MIGGREGQLSTADSTDRSNRLAISRIAEVDLDVRCQCEATVCRHFLPSVPSQRSI